MRREPAALVQDGVPLFHVCLGKMLASAHLFGQPRGQFLCEEAAHFFAKSFVFRGKIEIHIVLFPASPEQMIRK